MKLEPLYELLWEYRQRWRVPLPETEESMGFAYVEGEVSGRISGRFHGTNHARRRADGRFLTNVQGVITADDGVEIVFDYQGYGCPYPMGPDPLEDRTKVVLAAQHICADPAWQHLNDSVAIGIGENRFTDEGVRLLLMDFYEVSWEPLADRPTRRPVLPELVEMAPGYFDLKELAASRQPQ